MSKIQNIPLKTNLYFSLIIYASIWYIWRENELKSASYRFINQNVESFQIRINEWKQKTTASNPITLPSFIPHLQDGVSGNIQFVNFQVNPHLLPYFTCIRQVETCLYQIRLEWSAGSRTISPKTFRRCVLQNQFTRHLGALDCLQPCDDIVL